MTDKYMHHQNVVSFYRFKKMDRSESIQEAYSRGFCAGVDSIPKGDETKEQLQKIIAEQQDIIDSLHRKIARTMDILNG